MGLSNYQLVLLDNLIYLDEITRASAKMDTIGDVVSRLLYKNGDKNNGIGTGTIITDCLNAYSGKANSMMDIDEWKSVLLAIEADRDLCNLQIHSVEDAGENGFRAVTFISHKTQENVIIFRGTSTANEWVDNGQGGYSVQTENQYRAVEYVNNLDVVNNYSFISSRHCKGESQADAPNLINLFPKRVHLRLAACVAVHKAAKNAA